MAQQKTISKINRVIPIKNLRILTSSLFVMVVLIGAIGRFSIGNPSSFELFGLSFACPLGYLQLALAKRSLLPRMLLPVGLVIGATILFGRFYCAWLCPTSLLRGLFSKRNSNHNSNHNSKLVSLSKPVDIEKHNREVGKSIATSSASSTLNHNSSKTSFAILGGSLLSSFIFGFPVFCLICPIGLFFGTLFALIKLFTLQQARLELLIFPLILGVEVFVIKTGCVSLCPLGALLKLFSGLNNRFFRPRMDMDTCLQNSGINCKACKTACPEGIDVSGDTWLAEASCTNCLECYEKCPTNSIKFFSFAKRK